MTWQGTKTAGLAAEGPEQREGWRRPKCFVSRWKVQRKLWTPENTRGPPLRGQRRRSRFSGFTRPSRRRGARPSWGGRWLSIAHPKYGLLRRGRQQALASALAHALKEKTLPRERFAKGRNGAGWKSAKGGSAFGEADRASQRPLCPRSRRTKGCKKQVLRRSVAIEPHIALRLQGGAFLPESGEGWAARLALKRRPPCGGRGCGCRASWPCRRGCR